MDLLKTMPASADFYSSQMCLSLKVEHKVKTTSFSVYAASETIQETIQNQDILQTNCSKRAAVAS